MGPVGAGFGGLYRRAGLGSYHLACAMTFPATAASLFASAAMASARHGRTALLAIILPCLESLDLGAPGRPCGCAATQRAYERRVRELWGVPDSPFPGGRVDLWHRRRSVAKRSARCGLPRYRHCCRSSIDRMPSPLAGGIALARCSGRGLIGFR